MATSKATSAAPSCGATDIERQVAAKMEEAQMLAVAARPRLVVVDRDLPWAARLVTALREDPPRAALSMVVVARGDFDPAEVELLEAAPTRSCACPRARSGTSGWSASWTCPCARRRASRCPSASRPPRNGAGAANAQALNLSASGMLIEPRPRSACGDDVAARSSACPRRTDPLRVAGQRGARWPPRRSSASSSASVGPEESAAHPAATSATPRRPDPLPTE